MFTAVALVGLVGAAVSNADENFGFTRLAGNDRYATAQQVAVQTFGTSDNVVVASGETFPDALAAAYAAGLGTAPILLTAKDSLPDSTSTALTTLKAKNALIVGGTSAVSDAVKKAIESKGLNTTRVAGADRYDTAAQVARSGGASVVGKSGGPVPPATPTAIVVSGEKFPDALASGAMSDAQRFPILLTPQAGLATPTKAFLGDANFGIKTVFIIGGTGAVSQSVEDEIKAMGITVSRLAGNDRSETATKVADYEIKNFSFVTSHVDMARGDGFADALAGGPHGGKAKAPLLLTQDANTLGSSTKTWLTANSKTLKDGHIFGGTSAVSQSVETEGETAAGNTSGTTSSTSTTTTTALSPPPTVPCDPGQTGPGKPFCSGTADVAGNPKFQTAVLTYSAGPVPPAADTITVTYNEAVKCSSVQPGDYQITITDDAPAGAQLQKGDTVGVIDAACGNSGDASSTTVKLTPIKSISPAREGEVKRVSGSSVVDVVDNPQSTSDKVSWVGPKFIQSAASTTLITLTYDQALDCSTVGNLAANSDYDPVVVVNNNGTSQQIQQISCSASVVKITLSTAMANDAVGFVQLSSGNTYPKVANSDGQGQPNDDCIDFTVGAGSVTTRARCPAPQS